MNIDTKSSQLVLDLMSASAQRARVLANNVANQNVPNFKRSDVHFEELLVKEFERGNTDVSGITSKIVVDNETPIRADGNNVHMETEKTLQHENSILFDLYATVMKGQFALLRTAITGRRG